MKQHDFFPGSPDDTRVICDICGEPIPLGAEYVRIAAENDDGEIIGNLVAHSACAEALSEAEMDALMGEALGELSGAVPDDEPTELEDVLPLERCCLCGDRIGEADHINFIEPMHPTDRNSPLVAASFHMACYRTDPDGVQRALDTEIAKQRAERDDSA